MIVVNANTLSSIPIGRCGENLARKVVFDIRDLESLYGPGVAELIYQRPGDAAPYPVAAVREGDTLLWTPTATDTAKESTIAVGSGQCELRWYVGDILAKSKIWRTWVEPAMDTPSETDPPEPEKGWVDKVLEAGTSAKEAAERAEEAAKKAESAVPAGSLSIGDGLKWAADGKLTVDTADKVEQDNTKPVTSAAVHTEIGNIEALLAAL